MDKEMEQKAELTLLMKMEELETEEDRRLFAKVIGLELGEYLHLKQKYKRLLERYRDEQKTV